MTDEEQWAIVQERRRMMMPDLEAQVAAMPELTLAELETEVDFTDPRVRYITMAIIKSLESAEISLPQQATPNLGWAAAIEWLFQMVKG